MQLISLLKTLILVINAATATSSPLADIQERYDCNYRTPCHPKCTLEARSLDYCHCLPICNAGYEMYRMQTRYVSSLTTSVKYLRDERS